MELWAAVDLMDGSAVTLVQGRPEQKTVWNQPPVELAKRWESEGADGIHVVDLDAAFARGNNEDAISSMIEVVEIPVQVGGGMRTGERVKEWLERGAARVVLGTMAYRNPNVLGNLLASCGPGRLVVAADYKDGEVVTGGWKDGQGVSVLDAARNFEKAGVLNLLSTCVGRDGMASGPDVETVRILSDETDMKIIASGGIRDVKDLSRLKDAGAEGAIIGRALYDGSIKLAEAKRVLS